jgi:hypothetical protein
MTDGSQKGGPGPGWAPGWLTKLWEGACKGQARCRELWLPAIACSSCQNPSTSTPTLPSKVIWPSRWQKNTGCFEGEKQHLQCSLRTIILKEWAEGKKVSMLGLEREKWSGHSDLHSSCPAPLTPTAQPWRVSWQTHREWAVTFHY